MDELLDMAADDVTTTVGFSTSLSVGVAGTGACAVPGSGPSTGAGTGEGLCADSKADDYHMVVDDSTAGHTNTEVTNAAPGHGLGGKPAPKLVLQIMDFTPAQDHQQGGGTKVLLILAGEIPPELQRHTIQVSLLVLGWVFV